MYSESDIEDLRFSAAYFGLDCPDEFFSLPAAELAAVCNGVGPAGWGKLPRWILTNLSGKYAVVAAIHDLQQEQALLSNREAALIFLSNALKIHRDTFGGVVGKGLIYLAYLALLVFGSAYWKEVSR